MKLRPDLVLVKLAPADNMTASGLITAPALPPAICYGKVVDKGTRADDVELDDIVAFGPSAGDPLEGMFATPHLLVSVRDIDAIIPRRDLAASEDSPV